MRKSKTLAKIRSEKLARVCSLGHFIPSFVYHAARAGYDCIWLDLEHRALTLRETQAILAYCHLADIDCMVRTPTREKVQLYRYLEDGATGLMIPHVNSADEARDLVRSTRFPPIGERGFDNAGLDSDFYHHSIEDYATWAHNETFLTVQIETPQAVECVEEIAAVEGVDILFVGPGDLGYRLRHDEMGDADGGRLEAAFQKIADATSAYGKTWACPSGGVENLKKRYDQGCRFLVNASDFFSVLNGLNAGSDELDMVENA